jgi:acyl-CoA synthetase (NDP forming)
LGQVARIMSQVQKEDRKFLLETEAKNILREYGVPVTDFRFASSREEAIRFADELGYPVVLKIVSPDIIHKSDVGGVIINLDSREEVQKAYKQILSSAHRLKAKARLLGVLVQKMAPASTEVIIGAIKDPQFGPALMFGLGGIFVEVLKDVSFRIAPIYEDEAREMISEVKAYPLLKGYRNTPPADIDAIIDILLKTSKLIMDHQNIKELDLNPIIVYEKGATTVDARIILE